MPTPTALDGHTGYWLRYVSNHVSQAFRRSVEATGVTVSEWVVLRHLLDASPAAPAAIAEGLGMTRGAISKLIDRLEAKQLVTRVTVAEDRRRQQIDLTPGGRELVPRLAAIADANDEAFFGHLSSAKREALDTALRDLVRHHQLQSVPID